MNTISSIIASKVELKKPTREGGKPYTCPWDVAKVLYPEIKPYLGWGEGQDLFGDAPLFNSLLGEHMNSYKPWVMDWAKRALERMRKVKKGESIYAGDLDFVLELLYDTSQSAIFHLRNTCTCSLNDSWIIIYEHTDSKEVVHVRACWNVRGKQEKQSVFDDGKPTFRYFKKTNFDTPYKDSRDPGYVLSHTQYKLKAFIDAGYNDDQRPDQIGHLYNDWRHALYNMHSIAYSFNETDEA